MEQAFTLETVSTRAQLRAPVLRALFDLWQTAAAEAGGLPVGEAIDPDLAQAADIFWWLEIVPDAGGGPGDFRGRRFGLVTCRNYGIDPTGRLISEFARIPAYGRILHMLRAVTGAAQPQRFTVDQSVMSHGRLTDVEALGLPVGDGQGRLIGVLGATLAHFD